MTKKFIDQTITIPIYVAEDGTEFGTEWDCIKYERDAELHNTWNPRRVSLAREEEEEIGFFFIASKEELISFIDYLVITADIKVSGEEYSYIMRNEDNYINTWVTYNYDNNKGFYLFTVTEKENIAKENLSLINEELNFYALLKEYHP